MVYTVSLQWVLLGNISGVSSMIAMSTTIKLCENTKNYKFACPGANKVVYGACEQESEEKNSKFWFLNM